MPFESGQDAEKRVSIGKGLLKLEREMWKLTLTPFFVKRMRKKTRLPRVLLHATPITIHTCTQLDKRFKPNMKFFQQFNMSLRSWILVVLTAVMLYPQACNAQIDASPQSLFQDTPTFLKVEQAFKMDFEQRGNELVVKWDIADGYYLYRDKFSFKNRNVETPPVSLPTGIEYQDEFFGVQQIFTNSLKFTIKLNQVFDDASITIRYQGCAKKGLCYPPESQIISLSEKC